MTKSPSMAVAPSMGFAKDQCSMMEFRRFVGPEGLSAIRDDWQAIQQRLDSPRLFHLHEWYANYLDSLEEDPDSVQFFVAYKGDTPVAVFPLRRATWRIGGLSLRCLETVWHAAGTLGDCLWMSEESAGDIVPQFIEYLRAQREVTWDVLYVRRAAEDSPLIASLRGRTGFFVATGHAESSNYLATGDYQELTASLSKHSKGNLRRAHVKFANTPDAAFHVAAAGAELERAFEQFMDLEASGWKGAGGTGSAIKLRPRLEKFYRGLMRDSSSVWKCEICLVKAGDVCLAGGFFLLVGDTCYFLKTAHNEEYRHMSPGHLLLDFMSRRQSEAGQCKYIDLMTDTPWQRFWNPSVQKACDGYVFARTLPGIAGAAILRARLACGRVKRAIAPLVTRKHAPAPAGNGESQQP